MKKIDSRFTLILQGGLGNQLFQFFAGKYFSMKSGIPVLFDTRLLSSSKGHLNSDIQDFSFTKTEDFFNSRNSFKIRETLDRSEIFLAKRVPIYGALRQLVAIDEVHFSREIPINNCKKMIGYFQCRKYFEEYKRSVGEIDWATTVERMTPIQLQPEISSPNNIVLHVRGGDFLSHQSKGINLGIDFYRKGIRSLELGSNAKIFVFTDDFNHAMQLLHGIPNLEFVDQKGLRASEVLVSMSQAQNLIISNSTLSYWSAVASKARIIAPNRWLKIGPEVHQIYPRSWKIISID